MGFQHVIIKATKYIYTFGRTHLLEIKSDSDWELNLPVVAESYVVLLYIYQFLS